MASGTGKPVSIPAVCDIATANYNNPTTTTRQPGLAGVVWLMRRTTQQEWRSWPALYL